MGKQPAFQFYPGDWSRDLEEHPLEIEGAWIRVCCKLWWSETKGQLTRSPGQWSKVLGVSVEDVKRIFDYINLWKIGDVFTDPNGNLTVISRRMVKDEKERENNCLRQKRHYQKSKPNASITATSQDSSSSSSISLKKKSIKKENISFEENHFLNIPDNLIEKWKSIAPAISIKTEIAKAEAWVMSNPKLKKSNWSRFLTNWMIRAQDSARNNGGNGNGSNARYPGKTARSEPELPADVRAIIDEVNARATKAKTEADGKRTDDPG